jgi:hypothetical protein
LTVFQPLSSKFNAALGVPAQGFFKVAPMNFRVRGAIGARTRPRVPRTALGYGQASFDRFDEVAEHRAARGIHFLGVQAHVVGTADQSFNHGARVVDAALPLRTGALPL